MFKRRQGLRKFDIAVAIVLGIIGGNYVWKPVFEQKLNKDKQVAGGAIENASK